MASPPRPSWLYLLVGGLSWPVLRAVYRLRATGRLIADQYAMARRVGFDEVQVAPDIAARQPQEQWRARADWKAWDHRAELAG